MNLSNRQKEVVDLVCKGLSNREIANQLFITEKTVKFHLTTIFKLSGVKNRTQLVLKAWQNSSGNIEAENGEK